MKEELIRYVMEKANNCYSDDFPIHSIEEWIQEFFDQYQPESSERKDLVHGKQPFYVKFNNKAVFTVTPPRCGTPNSMET